MSVYWFTLDFCSYACNSITFISPFCCVLACIYVLSWCMCGCQDERERERERCDIGKQVSSATREDKEVISYDWKILRMEKSNICRHGLTWSGSWASQQYGPGLAWCADYWIKAQTNLKCTELAFQVLKLIVEIDGWLLPLAINSWLGERPK